MTATTTTSRIVHPHRILTPQQRAEVQLRAAGIYANFQRLALVPKSEVARACHVRRQTIQKVEWRIAVKCAEFLVCGPA